MAFEPIPELDVLIATAVWLHSHGSMIEAVSIPRGQRMSNDEQIQRLIEKFSRADVPFERRMLKSEGPDIVARFESGLWKIECKGLGTGRIQTLKNNFDRAVASTVSYHDQKEGLRLGLAVPDALGYLDLIKSKIPQSLREAINLWVFLYDRVSDSIDISFEPDDIIGQPTM